MKNITIDIFKTKIRTELEAYGPSLTEVDIEQFISELPNIIQIARDEFTIDTSLKDELLVYTKKQFGFISSEHVYIKGCGIYNDGDEIELDKQNWHYYRKHLHYISDEVYPNNNQIVNSIDYETDQIIRKFPRPTDFETFNKRGLVVGYVQSGKTANFTHLISKAASIGYRFVIVLAGMTDTLRMQTQFRLEKELIGNNSLGIDGLKTIKWLPGEEKFQSLTGLPNRNNLRDNGDFFIPANNFSDRFANNNDVTIAVIKKLARNTTDRFGSIIGNLINWIENRYDKDPNKMPPVLIIDDEADQASIDSTDEEADPTVINHAIRKLISLFPKSVYVGYTATPFANVFISPKNEYLNLDDLYPKDFIYSLPLPENYFGSNIFFDVRNKKNELAFIEYLEDEEKKIINDEDQDITLNLKNAILDFIFSILIRKHRGNDNYCGMMIHTDHRNNFHNTVFSKVIEFVNSLNITNSLFENFNKYIDNSKSIGRLLGLNNDFPIYSYETFTSEVIFILDKLKNKTNDRFTNIRIINSREDKLDYLNEDLQYLICIGGNIMSRGVTIEGLTITYYLRDTLKYDTLLQMGRWFGYRKGYEDLLRIYTTKRIAENFEFVMGVEDDLRNEINRYIEEGLKPLDFAPKVRAHMRMQPTAKMGNSILTKSYSQQAVQTIYFDRSKEILEYNYNLGIELIQRNKEKIKTIDEHSKFIIEDIKINELTDFIKDYNYTKYNSFSVEDILKYINIRINVVEITNFNVLISSLKNKKEQSIPTVIENISINPMRRNKRKSKGDLYISENIVNLGVISDTSDIKIADDTGKLTLILYFIDHKLSDGFNLSDQLFDASLINFNPLGFTILFPKTNISNGELNYYQQIFE